MEGETARLSAEALISSAGEEGQFPWSEPFAIILPEGQAMSLASSEGFAAAEGVQQRAIRIDCLVCLRYHACVNGMRRGARPWHQLPLGL